MRHRHPKSCVAKALLGLLGAAGLSPAMAQINLYAEVSTYASHELEATRQQFDDADYLVVDGPGPFARLWVMADSDGQSQLFNGLGISWAQVAVGGVHL